MTKRSTAANLGRQARKVAAKPPEPANNSEALPQELPPQQDGAPAPDLAPEQVISILQQQVGTARNAFFRLAQVRAADLVKYEGKSWDDGASYINAEIRGLDEQLARVVPPPQGQG